jgi:hypothetical protein
MHWRWRWDRVELHRIVCCNIIRRTGVNIATGTTAAAAMEEAVATILAI